MTKPPLISVILPAYNGAKTIRKTIESVLDQTYANLELIVVDDGSKDETREYLAEITDPRVRIYTYNNVGMAANRNRGIDLVRGEYIAFIDQDDLWLPDKLRLQLQALERNPEAALSYTWIDRIDEEDNVLKPATREAESGDILAKMLLSDFLITCSCPLIRKTAMDQVGGYFDEEMPPADDWDLWLRLARLFPFESVPSVQVLYRVSANSASYNLERMERASIRVHTLHFDQAPTHLQYLRKDNLANIYRYLVVQALKGHPGRIRGLKAIRYLVKAVRSDPPLVKKHAFGRALLGAILMSILPAGLTRALFSRFQYFFDADSLQLHSRYAPETAPQPIGRPLSWRRNSGWNHVKPPIKVLDLDVNDLPQSIKMEEKYQSAMALIRLNGQARGQALLPDFFYQTNRAELLDGLVKAAGWPFWQQWLYNYLDWEPRAVTDNKTITATVAVCTRNRPQELESCLDGIMRLPDDGQEILVVDNCPKNSETRLLVERYQRCRYILEEKPGLSVARNRALLSARGEVVVFIDEDAVPDPDWLRRLLPNMNDPHVMCVTGPALPLELETETQMWFERYSGFGRGFQRKELTRESIAPSSAGQIGAGVNMALRRNIIDRLGMFDERIGGGTRTHSGEDLDMFSRILTSGYRIVYEPSAFVWHLHRQTRKKLSKVLYGYGVGTYAFWTHRLLKDHEMMVFRNAAGWLLRWQLPALYSSLWQKPGSLPVGIVLAQLLGCFTGPWAYLLSRIIPANRGEEKKHG
ncbi:MAG: glycosyltransferase family 2 protein [Anaerolineales bacterium]|nr:glycosyltransferase family 2 protein [Anaerolineales bacterium]